MATIDELIASHEVELEAAEKRRSKTIAEAKSILALASQEARSNVTTEEQERIDQLKEARDQAKKDILGIKNKLAQAQSIKAEEMEVQRAAKEVTATPAASRQATFDKVARVGREERTYHAGNDKRGTQFLRDVVAQYCFNDVHAGTRLAQHMSEERVERGEYLQRSVGTGAFTGLTVPQYLTDMWAPKTAALRPFADICNKHELPADGMTVNISKITTGSSVAAQATQNTAVSETNMADTLLTLNVNTAAGQQTVSRQAIDRGTGITDVIMDDLMRRYATNLDSMLINDATNGLDAVSQSNSVTSTDPAASGGLYGQLLAAASGVESAVLGFAIPDYAVMHSRRWYDLQAKLRAVWPLFSQPGITNIGDQSAGTNFAVGYNKGVRGVLPNGMSVVVDNNISTTLGGTAANQDEVFVVPSSECHLWEDPNAPVFIRAEQPQIASLGVMLVVYGYFAWTFARYTNATQKLTGAGLVAPTFAP